MGRGVLDELRYRVQECDAIPAALKRIFEGYLSYAAKDGTSIRPTERNVAQRVGVSRSTVSRHTQELVRLGLLVHDRNEDGTYQTFAYKHGAWAYVYHADLSPLKDPTVLEGFEGKRQELSEKRAAAARRRQQILAGE